MVMSPPDFTAASMAFRTRSRRRAESARFPSITGLAIR